MHMASDHGESASAESSSEDENELAQANPVKKIFFIEKTIACTMLFHTKFVELENIASFSSF